MSKTPHTRKTVLRAGLYGQALVEYGLILVLVALASVAALNLLGQNIQAQYTAMTAGGTGTVGSSSPPGAGGGGGTPSTVSPPPTNQNTGCGNMGCNGGI